jgi:uncharacterized protein YkwD
MAAKISLVLATASLAFLALAPNAVAAHGIAGQRVVKPAEVTATTSNLIAPPAACPDQSITAPVKVQEQAMRCMTNFARAGAGLGELSDTEQLDQSSQDKAEDVLRCDSFSHFACGREFTYWIREIGYIGEQCWHVGENLAWGTGEYGSVRAIFRALMNSPEHRQNILGNYSQVGISLVVGNLEGHPDAHIWATHFGSRCEG